LPLALRHLWATSYSAVSQRTVATLKMKANDVWKKFPRARRMDTTEPTLPEPTFFKYVADLPRRKASLIMQLRTGHVPLDAQLHR
ncbi:hypothetical protein BC835DRAFT_1217691, partial [Cytidiella melzeri]